MLETKTRAVHVVEVAPAGHVNVEVDVDDELVAGAAVAGVPGFVSSLFGVDIRETLSHVTPVLSLSPNGQFSFSFLSACFNIFPGRVSVFYAWFMSIR